MFFDISLQSFPVTYHRYINTMSPANTSLFNVSVWLKSVFITLNPTVEAGYNFMLRFHWEDVSEFRPAEQEVAQKTPEMCWTASVRNLKSISFFCQLHFPQHKNVVVQSACAFDRKCKPISFPI